MLDILDRYLISGWRIKVRQLWTVQLTALFGLAYAVATVWSALDGVIPQKVYITIGLISNMLVFIARLKKQPGVDE